MSIKLPFRIFAVDPATTDSGWAVLEIVSLNPLKIKVIAHGHLNGPKLLREDKALQKVFSKQFCVVELLELKYISLIQLYMPDEVVSESAFGYKHMSAVMALTLAIHSLRKASRIVLNKDVNMIPPTVSKKALTGSGGADKDQMRDSLMDSSEIYFENPEAIADGISEHEIDAIAHGNGYIKRDITFEVEQISAKEVKRKKLEKQKQKNKE